MAPLLFGAGVPRSPAALAADSGEVRVGVKETEVEMAAMTMVGNWTGPHPSSIHQPPTSTGVRPAGAHRDHRSTTQGQRPSSPPPPATGKRPIAPVVDIQICMALSGRPASLEGLSLEPEDVASAAELSSAAPEVAPSHSSWSGNESVVPLARARAVRMPLVAAAVAAPVAHPATVPPVTAPPPRSARPEPSRAEPSLSAPALAVPSVKAALIAAPRAWRRKRWLLTALAALVTVLLASAAQLGM